MIRGLSWGFSAHAKDIWTIPEWEKREKIAEAEFGVTCTGSGAEHLAGLDPTGDRIGLVYHGLDLSRFPDPPDRPPHDGPLRLVSVGRLVAKKGYDDLLAALSQSTNLAVGCYCEDERRCHRSVLRELLAERGADLKS